MPGMNYMNVVEYGLCHAVVKGHGNFSLQK